MSKQDRHDSAGWLVQSREMCLRERCQHPARGEKGTHEPLRTTGVTSTPLRLGAVLTDVTLGRERIVSRARLIGQWVTHESRTVVTFGALHTVARKVPNATTRVAANRVMRAP